MPLCEMKAGDPEVEHTQTRSPGGWKIPAGREETLDASIDLLDLSVRPSNALSLIHVATVRQLLDYPKGVLARAENVGKKSIEEIQGKLYAYLLGQLRDSSDQATDDSQSTTPFGDLSTKEFVDHMLSMLPERQRGVIADRYGLWDGIAETLQDVGDKLGVTRERIRQIEAQGLKRMHRFYKHGTIRRFIRVKICSVLETGAEKRSVVSEDEALLALAVGCTVEEAELGVIFLEDIDCTGAKLFASSLIEVERGVYCADRSTPDIYQRILDLVLESVRSHEKPLTEAYLIREVSSRSGGVLNSEELGLAHRVLAISPRVSRMRNGTFVLSDWVENGGPDAAGMAETALRLLGRPAHFREITEKVNSLLQEREGYNERTLHYALIKNEDKFIRVKGGTYGLAKWGLKKPPYVKDRIIELLSAAGYPLPLWHLEEKTLEVCNCKPASVRMTLNLNPKLFTKFDGEQYGLRENFAR